VAHERLAVHLVTALTIMAGCIWTALDLRRDGRDVAQDRPRRWVIPFGALLLLQIVYGALTAGLRAGHVTAEWPTMFGRFIPTGLFTEAIALLDDPTTVVFIHRSIAYAVAAAALAVAWRCWRRGAGVRALALGGMVLLQFVLGVLTVVNGVPIALGVAHQGGAALLVAATVWLAHWARQPHRQTLALTR
jgi:cytochrome c oxidase assembly protein subunit 15